MLRLTQILGNAADAGIAHRLHHLEHDDALEHIWLSRADTARHRIHAQTDKGTEVAIILSRSDRLANGAVLLLEAGRAIVVRLQEQAWLKLQPADLPAALELGYQCGNLHWKVKFDGATLLVAMEGESAYYLERLKPLLQHGRVQVCSA